MTAIRTTAFTIWVILIVIAFEFGVTLPDKIDQLPANTNNFSTVFFALIIVISFLYFISVARARWESDTIPKKLGFLNNVIERERIENFVLAVQPTNLLIACVGIIGVVGVVQTANSSQASLSYAYSALFLVMGAGQSIANIRRNTFRQLNEDV